MKLYIVSVDEIVDGKVIDHPLEPYTDLKEARRRVAELFQVARRKYKGERFARLRFVQSFSIFDEKDEESTHCYADLHRLELAGGGRLRVIFGEQASRTAASRGADYAFRKIRREELDGSADTFSFDTRRDMETAKLMLDICDGWLGNYYEEIKPKNK